MNISEFDLTESETFGGHKIMRMDHHHHRHDKKVGKYHVLAFSGKTR